MRDVLGAEDEQQREADRRRRRRSRPRSRPGSRVAGQSTPSAPTNAQTTTKTIPVATIALGVGSIPSSVERPRRAEVGDRRVGDAVGADSDPAAQPAVRRPQEPARPLVGAARDRELGRELGVDGEQQALSRQRDRQHPHPRRPGDERAHEHDGVEPDDRRDRREAQRGVVRDAQAAGELLGVAELVQARDIGIDVGSARRDGVTARRRLRRPDAARARSPARRRRATRRRACGRCCACATRPSCR